MSGLVRVAAFAVLAAGCIGRSPEQEERAALGPYEDGDEFHRPGQPCLTCHREGYSPGGARFLIAGTVYLRPNDASGIRDIEVVILDGLDREIVATTNQVGTFFVQRGGERRSGGVGVAFDPAPPYRVSVRRPGGTEQVMQSLVWRDGSCAGCHSLDGPNETSAGRVYLMEAM